MKKWIKSLTAFSIALLLAGHMVMPITVSAEDGDGGSGDITDPVEVKNENKDVNGSISVEGADALTVEAIQGESTVTVAGDITATNGGESDKASGVVITANSNMEQAQSDAKVTVEGDVKGDNKGITTNSLGTASVDLTVNGNVSGGSKGIETNAGIYYSSETAVNIGGNVESEGEGVSVYSLGVSADTVPGTVINVDGSVKANGTALNITALSSADSESDDVTIRVGEDLTSNNSSAIKVMLSGEKDDKKLPISGSATVIVEGTISSGDENAVISTDATTAGKGVVDVATLDTLNLTVWKIETKDGQKLAVDSNNKEDEAFEKRINYIIKVEPNSNVDFTAQKDGSPATSSAIINGKEYSYNVANESDKVILKINSIADGYKLVAAYNGKGEKTPIQKDNDGNYFIVVPRGGGIYLSVVAEKDPSQDVDPVVPDADDCDDEERDTRYIEPIDLSYLVDVTLVEEGSVRRIPKTADATDLHFWTMLLLAMMGTAFVSSFILINTEAE